MWDMSDVELLANEMATPRRAPTRRHYQWLTWCAVGSFVLAGSFWFGLGRTGGLSRSLAVERCATATNDYLGNPTTPVPFQPVVVGLGHAEAFVAAQTSIGWRWCFMEGSGPISAAELRAPVAAIAAVLDGGAASDVLMLVHLNGPTSSVVVTTAWSRSIVLGRGGGFEVLRIPMAKWPHWHVPWSRMPVPLGRIIGFDRQGQVTSSLPYTWCQGSFNIVPGLGC